MIDINSNQLPIIILANCRTGSTALGSYLAKTLAVPFFSEPFNTNNILNPDKNKLNFISFYTKKNNKFVLKFMPTSITDFTPYDEIMSHSGFKIKLLRKDVVAQLSSLYIASCLDIYHKNTPKVVSDFQVPICKDKIIDAINVVLRNEFLFKRLSYKYNMTLFYEDLGIIQNAEYFPSDKPTNMEEIKEEIRKILRWRWSSLKEHLVQSERFELSTPTTSR